MQLCSVEDRSRVRVSNWHKVKVVSDVLDKFKKSVVIKVNKIFKSELAL